MSDFCILTCYRVEDLTSVRDGSVRGHYCSACGTEVWVMPKNLTLGMPIQCFQCVREALVKAAARGEEIDVYPASEAFNRN